MKEYQRITQRREPPLVMSQWSGDSHSLKIYNRLAELEDKIEGREFVPAAEYESARHRAEVAERALSRLCDETMRDIRIIMYPTIGKQVRDKQELYDFCIEQAEKELTEEGKE